MFNLLLVNMLCKMQHITDILHKICLTYFRQKSRASQQGLNPPAQIIQTKGPDEQKIKQILERTGYTLDVTTGMYEYIISYSNCKKNLNFKTASEFVKL